MKYVVKLGGATLENSDLLHGCASAITELVRDGHKVTVVHGGGVALTRTLKLLGKQSEFVAGLRVTDAETRDTAVMVLGGQVNKASPRWAFPAATVWFFAHARSARHRT